MKTKRVIKEIATKWLDENYPFRKKAVELVSESSGLSREMISLGLDVTFRRILDGKFRLPAYSKMLKGRVFAIIGGIIPAVTVETVVACLFEKRPLTLKPPSIEPHFGRIFIESIAWEFQGMSDFLTCLSVSSSARKELRRAIDFSDTIVVYGEDSTVKKLRLLSAGKNFIPNGNMASFGYIDSRALADTRIDQTASLTAYDVAMYDQQGCLSPQIYFVGGGYDLAFVFAQRLHHALKSLEIKLPIGKIPKERQFFLRTFMDEWHMKSLKDSGIKISQKETLTNSVILDPSPECYLSPNFRVVFVKPVGSIAEMLRSLAPFQKKIKGISTTTPTALLKKAIDSFFIEPPEIIITHGYLQFYH